MDVMIRRLLFFTPRTASCLSRWGACGPVGPGRAAQGRRPAAAGSGSGSATVAPSDAVVLFNGQTLAHWSA